VQSQGCRFDEGPNWATGDAQVRLSWIKCDDKVQSSYALNALGEALEPVGSSVLGSADQAYRTPGGAILRNWSQGPFALQVVTTCNRRDRGGLHRPERR